MVTAGALPAVTVLQTLHKRLSRVDDSSPRSACLLVNGPQV